jgi:hypothetical protein
MGKVWKITNMENDIRNFKISKWHQLKLSSLYLAKVMAIPDFFKSFCQEISKISKF